MEEWTRILSNFICSPQKPHKNKQIRIFISGFIIRPCMRKKNNNENAVKKKYIN